MMSPHVTALRDACQALITQAAVVKDAILDHRRGMWCAVPSFDSPVDLEALQNSEPSSEAWYRVADELTSIWMDAGSTPQNHGVLVCDVKEVLDSICELNRIKHEVQLASQKLKGTLFQERHRARNRSIDDDFLNSFAVANAEFLSKGRDHSFHRILRNLHLPSLNFMRAQKQIRVLEDSVVRIAYTWNKNQYRKRLINEPTLRALSTYFDQAGNYLRGAEIREGIYSHQAQSGPLYRLVHMPPTLRANYKWWDHSADQYQWSHCLATGILVVPQSERPQIRWKPAPTAAEIKQAKAKWLNKAQLQPVELATRLELFRNTR